MENDKIYVRDDLMLHCRDYGRRYVEKHHNGARNISAARNPMYLEVDKQAAFKAAECALAIWCGLEPLFAVDWDIHHADAGHDVIYGRARLDAKWIPLKGEYLMWVIEKNDLYHATDFTALVAVRELAPRSFLVDRWIDKPTFYRRKLVATDASKLAVGTWYLPIAACHEMADLRAYGDLVNGKS